MRIKLIVLGINLLYNVMLVSTVQQNQSVTHYTCLIFFRFFSSICHYRVWNRVSCALH